MNETHEKRNMTVWLNNEAIEVFEDIAQKTKRTRNYVLARLLEGIAELSPKQIDKLLSEINCKELVK